MTFPVTSMYPAFPFCSKRKRGSADLLFSDQTGKEIEQASVIVTKTQTAAATERPMRTIRRIQHHDCISYEEMSTRVSTRQAKARATKKASLHFVAPQGTESPP